MKDSPRPAIAAVKRDISTRFAPRGEEWALKRPGSPQYHGPTLRQVEIGVRGLIEGEKEEADQQSKQTGYGDKHQAEDGEAMQEDNTHSTGVASEQSEEPERGTVGGSDVRNTAKAACVEGKPGVEDTVDSGEEIL